MAANKTKNKIAFKKKVMLANILKPHKWTKTKKSTQNWLIGDLCVLYIFFCQYQNDWSISSSSLSSSSRIFHIFYEKSIGRKKINEANSWRRFVVHHCRSISFFFYSGLLLYCFKYSNFSTLYNYSKYTM